jgi:hypothetical protein
VEACGECGFVVPGGSAGCQRAFEELVARDFSNVLFGRWHRALVDVYALQHPDRYCASAKSFAAHAGGLCCWLERGGDAETYRALQRFLDGRSPIVRPATPTMRGALTIGDVAAAAGPRAYGEALDRWARATWSAYAALHTTARGYLDAALAAHGGAAESSARRSAR